jgi:hypothetical protein
LIGTEKVDCCVEQREGMAFDGESREAIGDDEDDVWVLMGGRGELLECLRGFGTEGAAEVGAAEVELAWILAGSGCDGAFEGDALQLSLLQCVEEGRYVQVRVDGVAGHGVIELEAELSGGRNRRTGSA